MKMNFTEFKEFIKDIEKDGIKDDTVFNITADNKAVNYFFFVWKQKKKRFENGGISFYKYCKWKNSALGIVGKSIEKKRSVDVRRCKK